MYTRGYCIFCMIKTFIVIVQYNLVTSLSIASYKAFLFSLFHPYLEYVYITKLLHDSEEDTIYSPRQNDIFRGQHLKEIWFFLGNKSAYFPNLHAMNCLLYWPTAAYIHVEYTEFQLFFQVLLSKHVVNVYRFLSMLVFCYKNDLKCW